MSEAANLIIQRVFVMNSAKHQFFYMSIVKGPFLGLKQFPAAENPLKMMKNAFYFHVLQKALFILEIFKFLLTF